MQLLEFLEPRGIYIVTVLRFKNPFFVSLPSGFLNLYWLLVCCDGEFCSLSVCCLGEEVKNWFSKPPILCFHLIPFRTCTKGNSKYSFTTNLLHAFQGFLDLCCITSVAFLPGWNFNLSIHYYAKIVPYVWLQRSSLLFKALVCLVNIYHRHMPKYFICLDIYCCKTCTWTGFKDFQVLPWFCSSFFVKLCPRWQVTVRRCWLVRLFVGLAQLLPSWLLENCLFKWCFSCCFSSQIYCWFPWAMSLHPHA